MTAAASSSLPARPLQPRTGRAGRRVAVGFWAFTYLLLTVRAALLADGFDLFSLKRLVATAVGALLLGGIVAATEGRRLSATQRVALVGSLLPASAAVFAVRVMLDYFYYGQPLTLADDMRWVLVWAGYFGLWLSAALAFGVGRPRAAATPASPAARQRARPSGDVEDWQWLADAIADEVAAAPQAWRSTLAERLVARAGYASADELDPEYRRSAIRRQLAARLARRLGD